MCPSATSETILCLNMIPGDRVHEMMVAGVRRYARARGWEVEVVGEAASRGTRITALFAKWHPVGCILQCERQIHSPPQWPLGDVPVVFLGPGGASRPNYGGYVAVDEEAVARAAFRELSAGKPEAYATVIFRRSTPWSLARASAFHTLVAAAGHPCFSFRGHWPKKESVSARARRFAEWLASLPRRCAVFAVNDDSAMEVAAAAHGTGRAIPRDITLLGADNDTSICEASRPTISSLQMDFENAGFLAAKMLGQIISRGDTEAALSRAPCGEVDIRIGPLLAVRRESTHGRGRRAPRIQEAVEIIRRKACDGLTPRELVGMFPGSRRLFELRFREAVGHSILDEIRHVRLQKAYALLAETDTPIGAIPDFCGYNCASTLDKLFRARENMSMQEWRRRHRF